MEINSMQTIQSIRILRFRILYQSAANPLNMGMFMILSSPLCQRFLNLANHVQDHLKMTTLESLKHNMFPFVYTLFLDPNSCLPQKHLAILTSNDNKVIDCLF